jgi:hypothetical protein
MSVKMFLGDKIPQLTEENPCVANQQLKLDELKRKE